MPKNSLIGFLWTIGLSNLKSAAWLFHDIHSCLAAIASASSLSNRSVSKNLPNRHLLAESHFANFIAVKLSECGSFMGLSNPSRSSS